MRIESSKFCFEKISWAYATSNDIGASPAPPRRNGVRAADVTCKKCKCCWQAGLHGGGQLIPVFGGQIYVECPQCHENEMVSQSLFEVA